MLQWVKKFLPGRDVGKDNDKPTTPPNQIKKYSKPVNELCRIVENYIRNNIVFPQYIFDDESSDLFIGLNLNDILRYIKEHHSDLLKDIPEENVIKIITFLLKKRL